MGGFGGGLRVLPLSLGVVLLTLPSLVAPQAQAAFPGRNGRIVLGVSEITNVTGVGFSSFGYDLFSVDPSGHALKRLTNTPQDDEFDPTWSPDGARIAFAAGSQTLATDIFVIDPRGGEATNLTESSLNDDYSPSWSPDGKKIVFVSRPSRPSRLSVSPDESEIYVMNDDGTDVVQLTDGDQGTQQAFPAWSPDGDVIAYVDGMSGLGGVDAFSAIRLMRPDGSEAGLVLAGEGFGEPPWGLSWSPDGRRIAFWTFHGTDIWIVNRDGSGLKNLTALIGGGDQVKPAWSPDGKWIAFLNKTADEYHLYKMRPDGSGLTAVIELTLSAERNGQIDWGPRTG